MTACISDSRLGRSSAKPFENLSLLRQENAKQCCWSRDLGLEMYIAWTMPWGDVTLATLWHKYDVLCRPQTNDLCARHALLKPSHKQMQVLMNRTTGYKINLPKVDIHLKQQTFLKKTYFYLEFKTNTSLPSA